MDGKSIRRAVYFAGLALVLAGNVGCFGIAAQLGWMLWGRYEKAEYDGLKDKRVAVVVVSDASSYGPNVMTKMLATHISTYLNNNVKNIEMINQSEIEKWKDANNWQIADYVELGRALNADRIVAVEISSYSLTEGQTLYKGRANMTVSVYDLEKNGIHSYVRGPENFEFPKTHGRPAISSTQQQFESVFLQIMAEDIAKRFYKHEIIDNFAGDARPIE
jgi:hypothetical protein